MAINNVRFEPRSQVIAPPTLAWETESYAIDIAQVLLAPDEYFTIPGTNGKCDQVMNLHVQAHASNSIPLSLLIETEQSGQPNGLVRVELSPGGAFDYEHLTLSMLPLFKSEADFLAATINVVSFSVSKASVISYGATTGILDLTVVGAQASYA